MENKKIINIIGRGNVATHLANAFEGKAEINMVNPHSLAELNTDADLTIISVTDTAIAKVLDKLPKINGIVAHTSGSTSIDVFKSFRQDRFGVFYPLQTFSKSKKLKYEDIPFYIEASDKITADTLFNYALLISDNVRFADSSQREKLHIAAVLSCNFVNHLWALSEKYLKEAGLDFHDLTPLIRETFDKANIISPTAAQTGPAVREDMKTIQNHIDKLENYACIREIYKLLSDSIINYNRTIKTGNS